MSKEDVDIKKSEYFEIGKPKKLWSTKLIAPKDNTAVTHHVWRWVTVGIFIALLFANIYFEWGATGIASVVMSAMAAWYLVRLFIAVIPLLKSLMAKMSNRLKR